MLRSHPEGLPSLLENTEDGSTDQGLSLEHGLIIPAMRPKNVIDLMSLNKLYFAPTRSREGGL